MIGEQARSVPIFRPMTLTETSPSIAPRLERQRNRSVRSIVVQYAIGGMIAIAILAAGAVFLLRRTSTDESVRSAEQQTLVMARGIVEPDLTDALARIEPDAVAQFDRDVKQRLEDAGATRVKVWRGDGVIVYSDEPRLIGREFEFDADKQAVLATSGSRSGVSDLSEAENQYEPPGTNLLEVYTSVATREGTPLLFEAYFPYESVTDSRDRLLRVYAPIVVGSLLALVLLQLLLTISLSRRLRAEQLDRERLLHRAIRASDDERQRIARDLHDGIVQDLAGVSFTIAGALDQLGPDVDPRGRAGLRDAASATRRGIRQLRTLLVDLYPPNLRREGLESALADLLARAQSDGLETQLDYDRDVRLEPDDEALAFRVAQEAIRNTLKHAHATRIDLSVRRHGSTTVMDVVDDGVGFEPDQASVIGHFGLQFLLDASAGRGAQLERASAPGAGTRLRLTFGGHR